MTYTELGLGTWEGHDFPAPICLTAGALYCINYHVIVGAYCSFAAYGTIYTHCWSWYCTTWEGPADSFYWMIRFFGTPGPSATEPGTWSMIKNLSR